MVAFISLLLAYIAPFASAFATSQIGVKMISLSTCGPLEEIRTVYHSNKYYYDNLIPQANLHRKSPLSSVAVDDDTISTDYEVEVDNPLKSAGLSFISASGKSLGMLFYNIGGMDHKEIQSSLLQAGTHLVSAGESWTTDWDAVRESMTSASEAFYDISNVFGSANIDESLPLGTLFEQIGKELEDISSISGCCAVGPPSSSPNLLAVEESLSDVAKILKKNSVASTDEHMMCTLFKEVAELFGEMAGK